MESIAEVVIVSEKRACSSCKVVKDESMFIKCSCVFFKTCKVCRDTKKKYRDKSKALKIIFVDDTVSVSSSSSTTPPDHFGLAPPPPGIGL
jgi:hypothetical protein